MILKIDPKTDPGFIGQYEEYMLSKCGSDDMPNPHNAKHGIFHNYRPWEYDKVFKHCDFSTEDIVLDTGAMHTYFCIFASQFVNKLYATDNYYWAERNYMKTQKLFSPDEWLEYVVKKGEGKIIGESANITEFHYKDETFDKVLCISTIEHVKDDLNGIKELARVLKKGGRLLLTTEFNHHIPKNYTEKKNSYYRIYDYKKLKELIEHSGLKLKEPGIVENRNHLFLRKNVNVFICLEK